MSYLNAIHPKWPYHKTFFYKEHNPLPSYLGWAKACILRLANHLLAQEIKKIKNPLDDFYKSKSSTIYADLGSIVEHNKNITEINTPKGVHIQ
ncbi:hypothetical protein N9Y86_02130 [Flavobacteriaceae bacterium]|nr:hypothetical protein [Flavobacteriaceae bacterium]MDB2672684.1 hypothetical protein [Flavobacteriaceae bacterium]